MNATVSRPKRDQRDYYWIWEVLVFATISPALVYAILSVQTLPTPIV